MKHPHNITWNIEVGLNGGEIQGEITCTAPEGAECRLTCPEGCEFFAFEGHEHELIDNGECGYLLWLTNGDQTVTELYAGDRMPLREGPIKFTYMQDEGVIWEYLFLDDPELAAEAEKVATRRRLEKTVLERAAEFFAGTDATSRVHQDRIARLRTATLALAELNTPGPIEGPAVLTEGSAE